MNERGHVDIRARPVDRWLVYIGRVWCSALPTNLVRVAARSSGQNGQLLPAPPGDSPGVGSVEEP